MRIVFTREAKSDLDELRAWLAPLTPTALRRVTARLEDCIRAIPDNPRIGRPTPRDDVRELIEPRYGFLIPYLVRGDTLFVLRIYRSSRKPLDYEALDPP